MQIIHRIGLVGSSLLALGILGLGCQSQVQGGDGERDGNAPQGAVADKDSPADKGAPGCGGGPNDPGPGGGPEDPGCTGGTIGDGVTCQDAGLLKQEAWDLCPAGGPHPHEPGRRFGRLLRRRVHHRQVRLLPRAPCPAADAVHRWDHW
ncbi:MAG: hypothetical protein QM820_40260 [Minicystis sp.]